MTLVCSVYKELPANNVIPVLASSLFPEFNASRLSCSFKSLLFFMFLVSFHLVGFKSFTAAIGSTKPHSNEDIRRVGNSKNLLRKNI